MASDGPRIDSFSTSCLRESAVVIMLLLDADGTVRECNQCLLRDLELTSDAVVGHHCSSLLTEPDAASLLQSRPGGWTLLNFVRSSHSVVTYRCRIQSLEEQILLIGEPLPNEGAMMEESLIKLNNEFAVLARENARLRGEAEQARAALETTLRDLQTSYWHIQKIQEVLPICMKCNRVRNPDASWQDLADYLRANALFLSHGFCPECLEEWRKEHGL